MPRREKRRGFLSGNQNRKARYLPFCFVVPVRPLRSGGLILANSPLVQKLDRLLTVLDEIKPAVDRFRIIEELTAKKEGRGFILKQVEMLNFDDKAEVGGV
jgi:hypothetical protein